MSKSMADQVAAIPHLSKGEIKDLRLDVDAAFGIMEGRTGFPRIDKVDTTTVSVAGTDQDFAITGVNFGTDAAAVSATVGGLAMTVQVDPANTTVTLRLAVGTGLTIGDTALLHMAVDGVACLPVSLEVVA
jgi:hypothetical protein